MSNIPNVISQVILSSLNLYLEYKNNGYELDKKNEEQIRKVLVELNSKLKDLDDLPTSFDEMEK